MHIHFFHRDTGDEIAPFSFEAESAPRVDEEIEYWLDLPPGDEPREDDIRHAVFRVVRVVHDYRHMRWINTKYVHSVCVFVEPITRED